MLAMRSHRIVCAAFLAVALLFSQWAVAMHACGGMPASPAAHAANDARDPCCPDPAAPNTCVQHCDYGHATVDAAKPVPTLDVTLGPALTVTFAGLAQFNARVDRAPVFAPDPPPSIRFSVLRI